MLKIFLRLVHMAKKLNGQLVVLMVVDVHYKIGNFEWMKDNK